MQPVSTKLGAAPAVGVSWRRAPSGLARIYEETAISRVVDQQRQRLSNRAGQRDGRSRAPTHVSAQVIYAGNDAITQSTQLLQVIQANPQERPDAILFEPVGSTALPQVARAAVSAGIGWAVLNREASYVSELRLLKKAPVFTISADHVEIGRIQGRQFAALLPKGGSVLYIQGPSENSAAKERTQGMLETKPGNIQVTALKGQWNRRELAESRALLA